MNLNNVQFVKSAVRPSDFISDGRPQIVFAGKSNVGKSSVINMLLGRKNYARVGSQPGKTVHVNYFLVDETAYLVDLPGYGYAKVSKAERDRWGKLMEDFFSVPERISAGIHIVDCRHKPTADDVTMSRWFAETGCRMIVVPNKLDKVKKSEVDGNLRLISETLDLPEDADIIPVSAEKGTGRDLLAAAIEKLLRG